MGEWNRSTRELTQMAMHPETAAAIQKHIEDNNLGPILKDYLVCIETTSEKKKKGLFGGGGIPVIVTVILTPSWLVLAVKDEKTGLSVNSVQLKDMTAIDYADSPGFRLIQDTGVVIEGLLTSRTGGYESTRSSYFVGLGEEPAALYFKQTLFQAVQAMKK